MNFIYFCLYFKTYTKIISKWIRLLSARTKTIEVLKENRGINLFSLGLGKDFLDMMPKERSMKEYNGKLNFTKIVYSTEEVTTGLMKM